MSHHVLKFTSSVLSLFFVFHFLWIFVSYFVEVCLSHFGEERRGTYVPKGTQGVPKKEIYKVEKLRSLFCSLLLSFAGKSSQVKFYAGSGGGV